MSKQHGLTLGKFLPLHRGHELLLNVAAAQCDCLTVLVGTTPDDPYTFDQRQRWIRNTFNAFADRRAQQLIVVDDPDPNPNVAKDECGTVTDERYWSAWLGQNQAHLTNAERIFTSDHYGAHIAQRVQSEWFPVDLDRAVVPISASAIRANLAENFALVSDAAKPDVALTVAILGAESTGKSTLVKAVAEHFGCAYAPEWGRTISEVKPELNDEDFDAIVDVQARLLRAAQIGSNGLCLADTEAITTALFAPIYLGHEHAAAWKAARQQRMDLYIVLAPSVPWINDGTRILDNSARDRFHASILDALDQLGFAYQVIDASDYDTRIAHAIDMVETLRRE
jgi:HTH-type transcriptional repressor of NAD biosynthesis genes